MSTYLDYLNQISSPKTFSRKMDYIKYNFGKYIKSATSANTKILEIGPGLGEAIKFLNDKGFEKIDIIDNDQDILDNIQQKYKISRIIKTSDLENVENNLDLYKIIIATQLLEHLPKEKYNSFLKILYGHLQENGRIIITVPNMANPFTLCERYADLTHYNGFTDNSLIEICNQCEIPKEKIEIKKFNIPPYSLLNIARIILQKILHTFIFFLSIINGGSYSKLLTPNITLIIKK